MHRVAKFHSIYAFTLVWNCAVRAQFWDINFNMYVFVSSFKKMSCVHNLNFWAILYLRNCFRFIHLHLNLYLFLQPTSHTYFLTNHNVRYILLDLKLHSFSMRVCGTMTYVYVCACVCVTKIHGINTSIYNGSKKWTKILSMNNKIINFHSTSGIFLLGSKWQQIYCL